MKKIMLLTLCWGLTSAQAQPTTTSPAPAADLSIGGLIELPKTLSVADLKAMPSKVVKVSYTSGSGATFKNNTHTFRGVLLYDLLSSSKPRFDSSAKNDPLRWFVRAAATDHYVAVFSWAELDPAFGNKGVLLAYEQDGQPLADGTVELVSPGDGKGGRYVAHLSNLQVLRADY